MGWPPSAILALSGLVLAACTETRLEDEWLLTADQLAALDLEVVDSFPADGVNGIGFRIQPYVLFNRPLVPAEHQPLADGAIVQLSDGDVVDAQVDLDSDAMGLYLRPGELRRDRDYRLEFDAPHETAGGALASVFGTDHPTGAAFNMSTGLSVEQFGESPAQAQTLTGSFIQGVYPLWVMQVLGLPAELTGPTRVDIVFAPARIDDDPGPLHFLKREYGYVGRFDDVTVASDGRFDHTQPGVFLPLWSSDRVILLYLEDVVLSGQLSAGAEPRIAEMSLTGVLGTRWLLRLADEGGAWRTAIRSLQPDIDTNNNGKPDAATFTLSASPTPITLDDIDL